MKNLIQKVALRHLARAVLSFDPFRLAVQLKEDVENLFSEEHGTAKYKVFFDQRDPKCDLQIDWKSPVSTRRIRVVYDRKKDQASVTGESVINGRHVTGIATHVETRELAKVLSRPERLF